MMPYLRQTVGESLRNTSSRVSRAAFPWIAAIAVGLSMTAVELDTTRRALELSALLSETGVHVWIASNEGKLSSSACVALNTNPEVRAAGGLSLDDPVAFTFAPNILFQSAHVVGALITVLEPDHEPSVVNAHSAIVGSAVVEEIGDRKQMTVQGRDTPLSIIDTVNTEPRVPQANRWIFLWEPPVDNIDQCWVEMAPGAGAAGGALLAMAFASSGEDLVVRRWLEPGEFSRNPVSEVSERPQANAWIPASGVLVVIIWLGLWLRRSELALYRVLGFGRPSLLLMAQIETCLVLLVGATSGVIVGVALYATRFGALPTAEQLAIVLRSVASTVSSTVIVAPIPALIPSGRAGLAAQLKER